MDQLLYWYFDTFTGETFSSVHLIKLFWHQLIMMNCVYNTHTHASDSTDYAFFQVCDCVPPQVKNTHCVFVYKQRNFRDD